MIQQGLIDNQHLSSNIQENSKIPKELDLPQNQNFQDKQSKNLSPLYSDYQNLVVNLKHLDFQGQLQNQTKETTFRIKISSAALKNKKQKGLVDESQINKARSALLTQRPTRHQSLKYMNRNPYRQSHKQFFLRRVARLGDGSDDLQQFIQRNTLRNKSKEIQQCGNIQVNTQLINKNQKQGTFECGSSNSVIQIKSSMLKSKVDQSIDVGSVSGSFKSFSPFLDRKKRKQNSQFFKASTLNLNQKISISTNNSPQKLIRHKNGSKTHQQLIFEQLAKNDKTQINSEIINDKQSQRKASDNTCSINVDQTITGRDKSNSQTQSKKSNNVFKLVVTKIIPQYGRVDNQQDSNLDIDQGQEDQDYNGQQQQNETIDHEHYMIRSRSEAESPQLLHKKQRQQEERINTFLEQNGFSVVDWSPEDQFNDNLKSKNLQLTLNGNYKQRRMSTLAQKRKFNGSILQLKASASVDDLTEVIQSMNMVAANSGTPTMQLIQQTLNENEEDSPSKN